MANPFSFGSLTPTYGPLTGGGLKSAPAARPSGRSWMDPQRMEERLLRLQERNMRAGGGGGRASAAAPQAPMQPNPAAFTNATTGQITTILPPTVTDKYTADYARRYGRGQLESMGARFEPQVGVYDPRTGLSETLDPATAMQRGLLGAAQRSLLEGLRSGKTFSRSNPFA